MKNYALLIVSALVFVACSKDDDAPQPGGNNPNPTTGGLIASYNCNGDFNDSVNTYHGTLQGPTLTDDRFGNPNSAYEFDGTDDYISMPVFLPLDDGSIRYWYKTDNVFVPQILYYTTNSTSDDGFGSINDVIEFHTGIQAVDQSHFYILDDGTGANAASSINDGGNPSQNTIQSGVWYNFTLTYDRQDKITMYIDGVEILSKDVSGKVFAGHTPTVAQIGRPVDNERHFDGVLDDLKIYDKVLSAQEVMDLYQQEN